jgi:hypothetical protein
LKRFSAGLHRAKPQTVGGGVLLGIGDMGDDEILKTRRRIFKAR